MNEHAESLQGTIIVVDDNVVNASLLSHLIAKHGYAVETISNGRDAVRRAAAGGVDAMFLDLRMPDMDGFDAARAIRAAEISSAWRIPIIAVTADLHPDLRSQALAAGMDDFLLKPVSVVAVSTALEHHLPAAGRAAPVRESSGCLPICLPAFDPTGLQHAEASLAGSACRVLAAFTADLRQVLESLPGLIASHAFLDAQRLVHRVSIQTDAIGCLQLGQVLTDMADGLRAGDTVRCQRVLRALGAAHHQFRVAVRAEGFDVGPDVLNAAASAPGSAAQPR